MRRILIALAAAGAAACSSNTSAPSPPQPGGPTAPGTYSPEVLVGAGDIAQCGSPGSEATATLLDRLQGTVFTAGDNAYPSGRIEDFRDCYDPTWGRHLARTWPVPGNHEYEMPGASPYFSYFGGNAGSPGRGYYAYTLGAWRVIALNSEVPVSAGSPQAAWLRTELASNSAPCTAAYWHRPLVSSGLHGDNLDMRDLFRILYEAGVEFIVTGHDHIYERFSAMDADGRPDPSKGIREFIVGTGGAPLTQPKSVRSGSERQGVAWGVIRFELSPGSYRWRFVPVAGESFEDSGADVCH